MEVVLLKNQLFFLKNSKIYGKSSKFCQSLESQYLWEKGYKPNLDLTEFFVFHGAEFFTEPVVQNPEVEVKKIIGRKYAFSSQTQEVLKGFFVQRGQKVVYPTAAGVKIFTDGDYFPGEADSAEIVNEISGAAIETEEASPLVQETGVTLEQEKFAEAELKKLGFEIIEIFGIPKQKLVRFLEILLFQTSEEDSFKEDLLEKGPCLAFPRELLWEALKKSEMTSDYAQSLIFKLDFPGLLKKLGTHFPPQVLLGISDPTPYSELPTLCYQKVRQNLVLENIPRYSIIGMTPETSKIYHLSRILSLEKLEGLDGEISEYIEKSFLDIVPGDLEEAFKLFQGFYQFSEVRGWIVPEIPELDSLGAGFKTADGRVKPSLFLNTVYLTFSKGIQKIQLEKPKKAEILVECLVSPETIIFDGRFLGEQQIFVKPTKSTPLIIAKKETPEGLVYSVYIS